MTASSRRLLAVHILLSVFLYSTACCAFPSTSNSTQRAAAPMAVTPTLASVLSPASGLIASDCEHDTLNLLGWQQAYSPHGYTINSQLPSNCSTATWQALGCLKTLTNLTLTGSLPDLPDAWGANDSFPALQAMNFSSASLAGTLPSSWARHGVSSIADNGLQHDAAVRSAACNLGPKECIPATPSATSQPGRHCR